MQRMEDDDYVLTPTGPLGGDVAVSQCGRRRATFDTTGEALAFVEEMMDHEQYWPNVWWVSDHGNAWRIDLEGNEIEDDDEAEETEE